MYKFLGCMSILALATTFVACSDDDNSQVPQPEEQTVKYVWSKDDGLTACDHLLFDADGKENPNGTVIGNGESSFVFTGNQTIKKGKYLLKGWVYVKSGASLTIEPGTIIKGDKGTKATLIVEPGGKLIAKGNQNEPIVFTSAQSAGNRKPGDWGGLVICGKAPNNNGTMAQQIEGGPRTKHGGTDANDNSGVLSYVRIEFAGYPFEKDKEINGLTLGSVGAGTTLDHIQVSYSNDDSYEWFGGTVNAKYLIAYRGWDDDFDTDNGYSGNVQYGISIRDSRLADASQSNGFESDNNAGGTTAEPYTGVKFSYMSFFGPKAFDANFKNDVNYINGGGMNPENGSSMGLFQAAMHIRRNSHLSCDRSLVVGWPVGVILDNEKGNTQEAATNCVLKLGDITFVGSDIIGSDFNKVYKDELYDYKSKTTDPAKPSFTSTYIKRPENNNTIIAAWTAQTWSGISSILNINKKYSGIGAFPDGNDWSLGWANFDPQNTAY
ncbi:MAG: hypothetical protein SOZ80_08400 [Prevotella sp.]|nr:hypothetical protein [Prevotella sp.]MDD7318996.1 hypothetical protein [Prevotellaceae bacterium]MDY4020776.1 hypothetical protein [Prevotella sp.]